MYSYSTAAWLLVICAAGYSFSVTDGLVCRGVDVDEAARLGQCVSHPSAGPCPADETRCQPEAALFALCGAGPTNVWHPAAMVVQNCYSVIRYTAIATFVGGGYTGRAGIFNRCIFSGSSVQIEMYDQSCGTPFKLSITDSKEYFVVV